MVRLVAQWPSAETGLQESAQIGPAKAPEPDSLWHLEFLPVLPYHYKGPWYWIRAVLVQAQSENLLCVLMSPLGMAHPQMFTHLACVGPDVL